MAGDAAATGGRVEIVGKPTDPKGFVVLPRRWAVERPFGWLGKYRRLAGRYFETTPASKEAWIRICMSNLMLRRLARIRKSQIAIPIEHTLLGVLLRCHYN